MNFYNNFNELFCAQSCTKSDLSIFNRAEYSKDRFGDYTGAVLFSEDGDEIGRFNIVKVPTPSLPYGVMPQSYFGFELHLNGRYKELERHLATYISGLRGLSVGYSNWSISPLGGSLRFSGSFDGNKDSQYGFYKTVKAIDEFFADYDAV